MPFTIPKRTVTTAVTIFFIILGFLVVADIALIVGATRLRSVKREIHTGLEQARLPIEDTAFSPFAVSGLPAPVKRYFATVFKGQYPMISEVGIRHTGTFNTSEEDEQWRPFASRQRVITHRPGFDWEGRISLFPGLPVRVHDAYFDGRGMLHASLFGLFTMAEFGGTDETARAELMRFLAEAVWYPTALLPGRGVRWEAVDRTQARATLTDGDIEVSLLFRFNRQNLVESVYAGARDRDVAGEMVPTPWEGRFSDYETRSGVLIPMRGEVSWILPDGPLPYWRGRIEEIAYEYAG